MLDNFSDSNVFTTFAIIAGLIVCLEILLVICGGIVCIIVAAVLAIVVIGIPSAIISIVTGFRSRTSRNRTREQPPQHNDLI